MTEDRIYAWTAKRSAASLTVLGKDAAGAPVRLTHVDFITCASASSLGNHALAVTKDGRRVRLLA